MKKTVTLFIFAMLSAQFISNAEEKTGMLEMGDYAGSTEYIDGQNIEKAPFNFYYTHAGAQIIYAAEEISQLVEVGGKIESITFRYGDQDYTTWNDFSYTLKGYLQLIDQDQFTAVDAKYFWIKPVDASATAETTFEYDVTLTGSDYIELTLNFEPAFVVPKTAVGKSLLVTTQNDLLTGNSDDGQNLRPYSYTNTANKYRMACWASDTKDNFNAQVTIGEEINLSSNSSDLYKTDIPVAKISYKYEDVVNAISEVGVESSADVHYFNMQGVEVINPKDGIFIRVEGGNAKKVVL